MKDAFTAAHSDLIQNQIELTSSIESVLAEAASSKATANQITEVGQMLEAFNAKLNQSAKRLAALHDKS
ncbi:hypothetical protein ACIQAL_19155 [Pseudomonas sp. NPDC088368]|uniref:hypothetical protein n=1 Tax=Pseudomonas sp. NPDC088368 TaxID=3364453 RepID=UPI00380F4C2C